MINRQTYEEYFLLYIDGELSPLERVEVERFVGANPELKKELELLQQSVFVPNESVVFNNKETLYRKEEEKVAVIFFPWKRMAAAAAILIVLGAAGWIYLSNSTTATRQMAQQMPAAPQHGHAVGDPTSAARPPADQAQQVAGIKGSEKNISPEGHGAKSRKTRHATDGGRNAVSQRDDQHDQPIEVNAAPEDVTMKQATNIVSDVALTGKREETNIAVHPRQMPADTKIIGQAIHYADEDDFSDNNRIYFANTSFSKRNSLRVVFRKASRIIDRITTLQ